MADLSSTGVRIRPRPKHGETVMAKRYIVRLNDEERKQLTELLGKRILAAKKRKRTRCF